MRTARQYRSALVIALLLFTAMTGYGQEADERSRLVERQKQLQSRIADLRRDQDFLLFQKQMYEADSKYLILNVSAGKGRLLYRNRVLKKFAFSPLRRTRLSPGAVALTAKEEQKSGKRVLTFGAEVALETKQSAAGGCKSGKPLRMDIRKRDMASLFYALDIGSAAYLFP